MATTKLGVEQAEAFVTTAKENIQNSENPTLTLTLDGLRAAWERVVYITDPEEAARQRQLGNLNFIPAELTQEAINLVFSELAQRFTQNDTELTPAQLGQWIYNILQDIRLSSNPQVSDQVKHTAKELQIYTKGIAQVILLESKYEGTQLNVTEAQELSETAFIGHMLGFFEWQLQRVLAVEARLLDLQEKKITWQQSINEYTAEGTNPLLRWDDEIINQARDRIVLTESAEEREKVFLEGKWSLPYNGSLELILTGFFTFLKKNHHLFVRPTDLGYHLRQYVLRVSAGSEEVSPSMEQQIKAQAYAAGFNRDYSTVLYDALMEVSCLAEGTQEPLHQLDEAEFKTIQLHGKWGMMLAEIEDKIAKVSLTAGLD